MTPARSGQAPAFRRRSDRSRAATVAKARRRPGDCSATRCLEAHRSAAVRSDRAWYGRSRRERRLSHWPRYQVTGQREGIGSLPGATGAPTARHSADSTRDSSPAPVIPRRSIGGGPRPAFSRRTAPVEGAAPIPMDSDATAATPRRATATPRSPVGVSPSPRRLHRPAAATGRRINAGPMHRQEDLYVSSRHALWQNRGPARRSSTVGLLAGFRLLGKASWADDRVRTSC